MSEVKVNKISPRTACGTVTLGDSGDTFTIPAGVSITNSGTASGFGSTGEVSWVTTKKTATFTATVGEGYFCDTSGGAFTVNLPAGTAGNSFAVADYTRTFNSNNLTISPNGSEKIGGVAADAVLNVNGQAATFVYVDSTEGWINVQNAEDTEEGATFITATGGTITCSGNYKIHTFTGPGTFCVSSASNSAPFNDVSFVVVAGGGGGAGDNGGGAGAGGFRENKGSEDSYTASPLNGATPITVSAQAYPVTIGGGGAKGGAPTYNGCSGSNSVFSTITSAGGGRGGTGNTNPGTAGADGGSGGGGGRRGGSAGSGNTPPVSPAQGFAGGAGAPGGTCTGSGGGGGATVAGVSGKPTSCAGSGCGGAGATTSITASPVAYGGGGGGSLKSGHPQPQASGGAGGGGNFIKCGTPTAGTANSGGGGAGCAAGGSGVVIIRYRYQ
jgi:hypothetical protein